jgi:TPR repeat protein
MPRRVQVVGCVRGLRISWRIAITGILAAVSVAVSCRSNRSVSTDAKGADAAGLAFVLGDSYAIPPAQMEGVIRDANRGDPKAALRLWHHWEFFRRDQMNAVYWLRKAARNGSAMAQYNLAVLIRDGAEQGSTAEARYWFHQASLGGVREARDELQKLEGPPLLDPDGVSKTGTKSHPR